MTADHVLDHLLTPRLLWLDVALDSVPDVPVDADLIARLLVETLGDNLDLPDPDRRLQRVAVNMLLDIRNIDVVWTVNGPSDLVALPYSVAEAVLERLRRLVAAVRVLGRLTADDLLAART
jgi:hypothetical protein